MPEASVFADFLAGVKAEVAGVLDRYLASAVRQYRSVNVWGPDAAGRLRAFVRTGKMLRAGMAVIGYAAAGKRPGTAAVRAGAAVELIQAGLLIHDDIIDRDLIRRGGPALHVQYARLGRKAGALDAGHFGEGMGICLGDIALFMGFEILADLPAPSGPRAEILGLWSDDLCRVGLAQMQDLNFGQTFPDASRRRSAASISIRRAATRSRPRCGPAPSSAAAVGGAPGSPGQAGRDPGAFVPDARRRAGAVRRGRRLGKPIGSDIREAKLTLFMRRMFDRVRGQGPQTAGRDLRESRGSTRPCFAKSERSPTATASARRCGVRRPVCGPGLPG